MNQITCPCVEHKDQANAQITYDPTSKSHDDLYKEELTLRGYRHYYSYYAMCPDNEEIYNGYSKYYKDHSPACADVLAKLELDKKLNN